MELEQLIARVSKFKSDRIRKDRIGSSSKSKIFSEVIGRLNRDNNTEFYLDRDGRTFTIQGHREYGSISKRHGIIGVTVDMTLGGNELVSVGSNTIKLIVDDNNNYILVSLTKMKELGLLDNLSNQTCVKFSDNRFFYSWDISELENAGVILYRSA